MSDRVPARRIVAECMARDLGPKGVHVAYIVTDVPSTRKAYANEPDEFFIKSEVIADELWHLVNACSACLANACSTRWCTLSKGNSTRMAICWLSTARAHDDDSEREI